MFDMTQEERDLLLFIDNQLHWRETLHRKFDFDKVVLSEAVARDATPSQVKITATSNKYTHPKEAIRSARVCLWRLIIEPMVRYGCPGKFHFKKIILTYV